MARNTTAASHSAYSGNTHQTEEGHRPNAKSEHALDGQSWLGLPLDGAKQAFDALLDIQQRWLESSSTYSEKLALELKELQQARDPVELLAAQLSVAQQQMDGAVKQVFSAFQKMFDAQVSCLSQWNEKVVAAQPATLESLADDSLLAGFGKMQDEWLKTSQRWIDTMNAAIRSQ